MIRKLVFRMITVAGLSFSVAANAALYNYTSVLTACTGACASFASWADGAILTGQVNIDVAPGGSFGDADIEAFQFTLFNPAMPVSGPVGDPITDNPMDFASSFGTAESNGTAGSVDSDGELSGGQLVLQLLYPPASSQGGYLVFDLSTGNGGVCYFYEGAGCIPGVTEFFISEGQFSLASPIPVPGAGWLFGFALSALGVLRRRQN